jgi:hypothetical protein
MKIISQRRALFWQITKIKELMFKLKWLAGYAQGFQSLNFKVAMILSFYRAKVVSFKISRLINIIKLCNSRPVTDVP